jgi:hypothetical protein
MAHGFHADCRSVLIGSLPVKNHREAAALAWEYSPDIPLWVQLPANPAEGMIVQFQPGLPGLIPENGKPCIHTQGPGFEAELVNFYEEYLGVVENQQDPNRTRFALTRDTAEGFFVFQEMLANPPSVPVAVKGQVTGPITFATSITDQDNRAIFYNEQLRDAAVKLLSLKAVWQVKQLSRFKVPVIMFIDEPALAGFGSSEFTSISRDQVNACLGEVIEAVKGAGGIPGIHVCANTDWSLILETSVDIVNFDAYSFFDRFVLYPDHIRNFVNAGGILAWGIVPTGHGEDIDGATPDNLAEKLREQIGVLENLGIGKSRILAQSLISPSCGTGSLSYAHALKVLELTKSVSEILRKEPA